MILFTILLTTLLLIALVVIVTIVGGATLLLTFGDVIVCVLIIYFIVRFFTRKKKWGPSRSLSFRRIYTFYNEKGVWNYGSKRTKKKTSRNENKTVRRYDASITKHLRDREYQKGADDHAEKTPENAVWVLIMDSSVFTDFVFSRSSSYPRIVIERR